MREENEIDRAGKIDNRAGWACQPERAAPQTGEHIFRRQLELRRHTRIMAAESMQPMRVRCCDQRFAKFRRDRGRAAVRVQEAFVKMTKLDRVEAIDFRNQTVADRSAEHVEWMRRDGEDRHPARGAQFSQIIEVFQLRNFLGGDIENDDVRALQPHFGGGKKQNSHGGRIGKDFRAIKNGIVQSDGENTKTERPGALEKLMRRIIDDVFRIVEGVNVQIEFDPIALFLISR